MAGFGGVNGSDYQRVGSQGVASTWKEATQSKPFSKFGEFRGRVVHRLKSSEGLAALWDKGGKFLGLKRSPPASPSAPMPNIAFSYGGIVGRARPQYGPNMQAVGLAALARQMNSDEALTRLGNQGREYDARRRSDGLVGTDKNAKPVVAGNSSGVTKSAKPLVPPKRSQGGRGQGS